MTVAVVAAVLTATMRTVTGIITKTAAAAESTTTITAGIIPATGMGRRRARTEGTTMKGMIQEETTIHHGSQQRSQGTGIRSVAHTMGRNEEECTIWSIFFRTSTFLTRTTPAATPPARPSMDSGGRSNSLAVASAVLYYMVPLATCWIGGSIVGW